MAGGSARGCESKDCFHASAQSRWIVEEEVYDIL